MSKDYWEQWQWRLWMGDADLGMCHPATRGIWMDALCAMMERKTHSITGTTDQLARVCRCSVAEMTAAINDLEAQNAAEVKRQSDSITLTSRKRFRELELSGLRSRAGKSGADSRWLRDGKRDGKVDGKPLTLITDCSSSEGMQGEGTSILPPPVKDNTPDAHIPTLAEVKAFADSPTCGFPPARAEDWFHAQQAVEWKYCAGGKNWKHQMLADRTHARWMPKNSTARRRGPNI